MVIFHTYHIQEDPNATKIEWLLQIPVHLKDKWLLPTHRNKKTIHQISTQ